MILYNKMKNFKDFTCAEKAIVDFILKDPYSTISLSVEELANATFSSPSCVVRLAKKLGMKGYSDFKIKLATELNVLLVDDKRIEVNMPVEKDLKINEIPKLLHNLYFQTITDIHNSLDYKKITEVVEQIHKSDSVTMFGVGPSMLAIQDFIYKASHLRLPIYSNSLNGFENVHYFSKSQKPLTIVVSNNATGNRVRNWVFENKKCNIPVVLITGNIKSPLTKICDHVIILHHGENRINKLGSFASRISALYVLDIIYTMLFMKEYDKNTELLSEFCDFIKQRDERK